MRSGDRRTQQRMRIGLRRGIEASGKTRQEGVWLSLPEPFISDEGSIGPMRNLDSDQGMPTYAVQPPANSPCLGMTGKSWLAWGTTTAEAQGPKLAGRRVSFRAQVMALGAQTPILDLLSSWGMESRGMGYHRIYREPVDPNAGSGADNVLLKGSGARSAEASAPTAG